MTIELTPDDIEALAAKCYRSPVEFARVFFGDWFPQPMPWVHRGVLALLKGRGEFLLDFGHEVWQDGECDWGPEGLEKILTNFLDEHTGEPLFKLLEEDGEFHIEVHAKPNVVIVLPRGFSKTTIINLNTCHEIAYQDVNYVLYLSETGPHSEEQLETVKSEFESNEMLRLVFGDLQPARNDPQKWSAKFIETLKGTMVGAVGTGGQVRGKTKHAKRPDLLVFDDLQNETSVESETELKKDNRWFWRAAMKAGARKSRKFLLGTLLKQEAILNKAMANRQFSAIRFGAIDRQGDALWEWHMNLEQLEEDKQSAIESGELAGWYMEMMSEFRTDETRMFPESKLIYIHKGIELFVSLAEAMDPAISDKRKSAMAACCVVGIERGGQQHVLDFRGKVGMDADDQLDMFFEMHFQWFKGFAPENQRHGIESIAFQAALLPMARKRMVGYSRKYGSLAYFEITPITHGAQRKDIRIQGILKPLVWARQISFESQTGTSQWPNLHQQMVDFPTHKLKDGPDVVSMAAALLDPYVTLGLGEDEDAVNDNLTADTMPPLDQVIGGDWRDAP